MVEESHGKEAKENAKVGLCLIDELKGTGLEAVLQDWKAIIYSAGVAKRPEPESFWHAHIGEIGSSHIYHSAPVAFNKTVL